MTSFALAWLGCLAALGATLLAYCAYRLIAFRREWIILQDRLTVLQPVVEALQATESHLLHEVASLRNRITTGFDGLISATSRHDAALDNLSFELLRQTALTAAHPKRTALAQELGTRLQPIQTKLTRVLFPHHEARDALDYMYKLPSLPFPYSVTDEEGLILYTLIRDNDLVSAYEIATAFGYSSLFVAMALEATDGTLVTMDAYIEEARLDFNYTLEEARSHLSDLRVRLAQQQGDARPKGYQFAKSSLEALNLQGRARLAIGLSPDHVAEVLCGRKIDFAMVDGGHHSGQPTVDLLALLGHVSEDKVAIVFHDAMVPDVADAVWLCHSRLERSSVCVFNTRNSLAVVHRGLPPEAMERCATMVCRQPAILLNAPSLTPTWQATAR
ncbi:MAG: hypothetical protein EBX52_02450 [Proteobacteria bacterium]|nr:hypothetical protein [Pseudomonadota bacterium]